MRTRERASSSLLPAPPPHPGPRPPLPAPLPHACARSQHSRRSRWRLRISNARPVSKSSNCGWGGRWVGACGWLVGWVGGWVQVGAGGCRWAGGRGRAQPSQRKVKATPAPPPPPSPPPSPPRTPAAGPGGRPPSPPGTSHPPLHSTPHPPPASGARPGQGVRVVLCWGGGRGCGAVRACVCAMRRARGACMLCCHSMAPPSNPPVEWVLQVLVLVAPHVPAPP